MLLFEEFGGFHSLLKQPRATPMNAPA